MLAPHSSVLLCSLHCHCTSISSLKIPLESSERLLIKPCYWVCVFVCMVSEPSLGGLAWLDLAERSCVSSGTSLNFSLKLVSRAAGDVSMWVEALSSLWVSLSVCHGLWPDPSVRVSAMLWGLASCCCGDWKQEGCPKEGEYGTVMLLCARLKLSIVQLTALIVSRRFGPTSLLPRGASAVGFVYYSSVLSHRWAIRNFSRWRLLVFSMVS